MIKRIRFLCIIAFVFLTLNGCSHESGGKPDNRIEMPASSSDYEGRNYQEVINELEIIGFTNINVEVLDDLVIGWLTKDGEVEKISIDGNTIFSSGAKYSSDATVIITYHTFPEKSVESSDEKEIPSDDTADIPEKTVEIPEKKIDNPDEVQENSEKTKEPELQPDPASEAELEEVILTVENNEDFAEVLATKGEFSPLFTEFAQKYKGQQIEFDGHIDYVVNHGDYDTRWDILLSVGDWIDENTVSPGPIFKFNDVNTSNMGIEDLFLPAYICIGSDVHIIARIGEFNEDTGIFLLTPVLVTER